MISELGLSIPPKRPLRLLCLGAHSDDIEIGAGGTILGLIKSQPVDITWVVFSASGVRGIEAERAARMMIKGTRKAELKLYSFRDSYFPAQWEALKETFSDLQAAVSPDLILTHFRTDRHQDHRVISDLTWNAFRSHLILEYEIPKYDGDMGQPNCFVPLSASTMTRKLAILKSAFASQRAKHWFDEETFRSLARLRGLESGVRYAEAFHARKVSLRTSR